VRATDAANTGEIRKHHEFVAESEATLLDIKERCHDSYNELRTAM
jgi:hypothetical protein